jgi:hypothetical protein
MLDCVAVEKLETTIAGIDNVIGLQISARRIVDVTMKM